MENSPLSAEETMVREGVRQDPAQPSVHVLAGSHDFTIGSFSAITVGGDLNVQYVTEKVGPQVGTSSEETIEDHRRTLLSFLEAPTFHGLYANALEQRMAQTGSWFLELPHFKTFKESKGVTLWCTGMPGAGKTILASIAAEHLCEITDCDESRGTALAFAFLRYSERYTWRDVITSLLVQLVQGSDLACTTFWVYYARAAAKVASKPVILEAVLETALCEIAGKLERLYMVIDGLDEATDEVKDRLLETLVPSGVNLLILSRPLDLYAEHAPEALFVSVQAETKDIHLYVHGEVQRTSRLKSIFKGKPDRITELCNKVAKQSDGMFLVAKLQMEAIKQSSRSIASLFRILEALPSGVNEMYKHTLDRIRGSEDSSIAFRTLAWVAYADTELGLYTFTSDCLEHALSFNLEEQSFDVDDATPVDLILSACQGLVILPAGGIRVTQGPRFIHYTAYEYVKLAQLDGLPNPQLLLASACLACLESNHEFMLYNLRHTGYRSLQSPNDRRPLLDYSAEHWFRHVHLSQHPSSVFPFVYPYLSKFQEYPELSIGVLGPAIVEVVSGAHLIATHGLMGGFDTRVAQALLPNLKSEPRGFTPFHCAAMRGSFETFRALFSVYSGVNVRSNDGRSALHFATEWGHTSFIQQFRDFAALPQEKTPGLELCEFDVNAEDLSGQTPLMIACQERSEELIRMFSSFEGINLNKLDNQGMSALHWMICAHPFDEPETSQKDEDLAMMLCSIPDIDVNTRDHEGDSPFMSACLSGLAGTVKYLLARSNEGLSMVHQTNNRGQTPLMMACHAIGHCEPGQETSLLDIFDLLIAHGSDLHARDVDGMTPFLCTLGHGKSDECQWYDREFYDPAEAGYSPAKLLMERMLALDPTVIDHQDLVGRTALIIASQGSYASSIQWILAQKGGSGEYVNAQDKGGLPALLHASIRRSPPVVEALLASPSIRIEWRSLSALNWLPHSGGTSEILWMLKKTGEWGQPDIRKVLLRALEKTASDERVTMTARDFENLWTFSMDSFTWSLDESDTVLLLVLTASIPCRIPVALVLGALGLLPPYPPYEPDVDGEEGKCSKHPNRYNGYDYWDHDYLLSKFYSEGEGISLRMGPQAVTPSQES